MLAASWGKYYNSADGKLLMEFLEADAPRCNISAGTEMGATTGAYAQGWRDLMLRLSRYTHFIETPQVSPTTEYLKDGRTENNPYERPLGPE